MNMHLEYHDKQGLSPQSIWEKTAQRKGTLIRKLKNVIGSISDVISTS